MCGILAVVRRRVSGPPLSRRAVVGLFIEGLDRFSGYRAGGHRLDGTRGVDRLVSELAAAAECISVVDGMLRGFRGLRFMLDSPSAVEALLDCVTQWNAAVDAVERSIYACPAATPTRIERMNREMVDVRDGLWAIGRDRLRAADSVADLLAGTLADSRSDGAVEAMLSVHQVLSGLDRLEVRGRDSAGLHLLIRDPALDLSDPVVAGALADRGGDRNFGSGSARLVDGVLSIVYKTAAEIGDLGDNTAALRAAVTGDELLAAALADDAPSAVVLGHTRWASVGIISDPNAHPLNSDLIECGARPAAGGGEGSGGEGSGGPGHRGDGHLGSIRPYVVAAVNGDVDNYAELLAADGVEAPPAITTDSKAVPVMMSRRLGDGLSRVDAFRRTVDACIGSVAVAAQAAQAPERLLLALRGSGQGLYVGLADDAFIVASEPYGLVEETSSYVRMDGDVPADPGDPVSGPGQIIEINGARAGSLAGLTRWSYDGSSLPVGAAEVITAEITTRDIDRGDYPHFLLKEINEAPTSFRKTLRGRLIVPDDDGDGRDPGSDDSPRLELGPEVVPHRVRSGLRDSSIRRVVAVGQGTAAVAGAGLADGLRSLLDEAGLASVLDVRASEAAELSAFHLRADMSDTLLIAVSQSGTTTDTNRTVDLARARGATVVAVVNRRNSDLTERADGVLYTSDGRDVEMSVASTKAFYSQVAAGWLLAVAIADEVAAASGTALDAGSRRRLLQSLLAMPEVLSSVLDSREAVAGAARQLAPSRRHWAVVGNGANRVAAQEIRIKLSELCYKSIPCDATEDKKHIDLSSEPLVLVCAAGLPRSVADDVAKEVAIFRAHRGAPVVIADDGDRRFDAASAVLNVPITDPRLVCLPVTMVGHLFGYEAALAIDAGARPLRQARAALDAVVARADVTGEEALRAAAGALERNAGDFRAGLHRGDYDGCLKASTAVRITSVLRYALGFTPLEFYELELGRSGTPAAMIEDLLEALTSGIDDLTRPIDAIRHQAKTVTVGISRSDEAFLRGRLVRAVLAAGASRERLSYASLRTLAHLDPAVAEVRGHTRYRVDGLTAAMPAAAVRHAVSTSAVTGRSDDGLSHIGHAAATADGGESGTAALRTAATAAVMSQGGVAVAIRSRTVDSPVLTGTKRQVAIDRRVLAARGRHDGRTLVFVPEVSAGVTVGITLLHVRFAQRLPVVAARGVLHGYRNRYSQLRDTVTETESRFDETPLGEIAAIELLTASVDELADRWRAGRPVRSRRRPPETRTRVDTPHARAVPEHERADDLQAVADTPHARAVLPPRGRGASATEPHDRTVLPAGGVGDADAGERR